MRDDASPPPTPAGALPEAIRTARLLLRRWHAEDAPLLKAALDGSLAHLKASVAWARHEPTPLQGVAARLARNAAGFNAGDDWVYGVLDPAGSRVLGGCGCERAEPALAALVGPDAVEAGYWLRADATGRGYATEATAALVRAVFDHLGARCVAICHDPANATSGAVPRRLGFRCVGTVSAQELPGREAPDGSVRPATTVWVLEAGSLPGPTG
jgi:RimJ/RimL family protein N-acetyltransferase